MKARINREERERQWLDALAVPEDDRLFSAILDVIAADIEEAQDTAASVLVAEKHGALAHAAGGMAWLVNLRERLQELRQRATGVRGGDPG